MEYFLYNVSLKLVTAVFSLIQILNISTNWKEIPLKIPDIFNKKNDTNIVKVLIAPETNSTEKISLFKNISINIPIKLPSFKKNITTKNITATSTHPVLFSPTPFSHTQISYSFSKKNNPLTDEEKYAQNTFGQINIEAVNKLANLLCSIKKGINIFTITGSGVFIDAKGVLMTNAHIAQYFMVQNSSKKEFIDCKVLIGNSTISKFQARVFFIPSVWFETNYKEIDNFNPIGTGENDYALLLVTNSINGDPFPNIFSFFETNFNSNDIKKGEKFLFAAYPTSKNIISFNDLHFVSAVSAINEIYSFDNLSPDIFWAEGGTLAERGSSGGAVIDKNGKLTGVIVGTTETPLIIDRQFRALSMSYIEKNFKKETGFELDNYLKKDLKNTLKIFEENEGSKFSDTLAKELFKQ